jgi:hypothetical protein
MVEKPSAEALQAEFDVLMTRAGLTIPAERRADYLQDFADLRGQLALLHERRSATVEPANVFRVPGGACR